MSHVPCAAQAEKEDATPPGHSLIWRVRGEILTFFGIFFKTKLFFQLQRRCAHPSSARGVGAKTRRVHGAPLLRVRIQSCCSVVAAFRRFARVKKFDVCVCGCIHPQWTRIRHARILLLICMTFTYPPPHMTCSGRGGFGSRQELA